MKKELIKAFNEEVHRYRNTLACCAEKSEWDVFKVNAGKLFDYIESIEMIEIESKFFRISKIILFVLLLMVVFIFRMNIDIYPEMARIKELAFLGAVAGSCFQLYFFLNFRMYMEHKMTFYKKRRERFIRNIERDFKEY
ncbi:MAG: hypothetical protein GTO02_09565 [Candidatus Dadabacteria bacterium]|nr:hypothetical protein [Candidatus Dadabacteria bacterium]